MTETESQFAVLHRTADPAVATAIQALVENGNDRALVRINALDFATTHGFDADKTIGAFLHASRLGIFEMSWNVLCPGCGGVMDANASLKTVHEDIHNCSLCAMGYEPTLDEQVEVTFTVSPRIRSIAAHHPETLPPIEYFRQIFFSSGVDLPEDLESRLGDVTLEYLELAPKEKAVVSVLLPAGQIVVFDPVSHGAHFLLVTGEPTAERQALSIVYNEVSPPTGAIEMRPGPARISFDNQTNSRKLPSIWVINEKLQAILGPRKPFLTASRTLSNQTFRDLFRTDTLDIDQRLKIVSLTFLFTDLKGSTQLYDRVGDLLAFDLVRSHFHVLHEIVAEQSGAVVKTIGDAVMATFTKPDDALSAALRMRQGMQTLNDERGHEDLLLKIGIHEGPCLAVNLNDRQDYFGQTVNIAARVQGLAEDSAIFATQPVVDTPASTALLARAGITAIPQQVALRGVTERMNIYEIP